MKEELLSYLNDLIDSSTSIKLHTEKIFELLVKLDEYLTEEEKIKLSSKIKNKVHSEAETAFFDANGWAAVIMATGTGKSKLAINICKKIIASKPVANILLVVPTQRLRDTNWLLEFDQWFAIDIWHNNLDKVCYASLSKIKDHVYDLVIMDEGHNITENNSEFFENNTVYNCLFLSATPPDSEIKKQILTQLQIFRCYELNIDEASNLRIVTPYEITVVTMPLDQVEKYIKAGTKDKPFYVTEQKGYAYLNEQVLAAPIKRYVLWRMHFIHNLRSKLRIAKAILEKVVPNEVKTLIFCSNTKQADSIGVSVYHSKLKRQQRQSAIDNFNEGIEKRMACCDGLNEGHNIHNVGCCLIVQTDSSELRLVQRIGRAVRYRPDHKAVVIILCSEETEDIYWVRSSLYGINPKKVRWISLDDLKTGKEKISFD